MVVYNTPPCPARRTGMNPWDCKPMGREGGAFEGASWHAGKLTRGDLNAPET